MVTSLFIRCVVTLKTQKGGAVQPDWLGSALQRPASTILCYSVDSSVITASLSVICIKDPQSQSQSGAQRLEVSKWQREIPKKEAFEAYGNEFIQSFWWIISPLFCCCLCYEVHFSIGCASWLQMSGFPIRRLCKWLSAISLLLEVLPSPLPCHSFLTWYHRLYIKMDDMTAPSKWSQIVSITPLVAAVWCAWLRDNKGILTLRP